MQRGDKRESPKKVNLLDILRREKIEILAQSPYRVSIPLEPTSDEINAIKRKGYIRGTTRY